MKKKYIVPQQSAVELALETGVLAASGIHQDRFDVGMSDDAMNGSEALSHKKQDIWETEDIWN